MASNTFAQVLRSYLDIRAIDTYFLKEQSSTLEVLHKYRPMGVVQGDRFKLGNIEGAAGNSFDYNLRTHMWGDHANSNTPRGQGLIHFLAAALNLSTAQAVDLLIKDKLLADKDAKRALGDPEGDPLVLPIPEDKASWEYLLQQPVMAKIRALITDHWPYLDVDGTLLGWKVRVDGPGTGKVVYTFTFRAQSGWTKKAWQRKLVPVYGLEKLGDGTPNLRIVFVEGEKAAEAAQRILGKRYKVLAFSGLSASHDLWIPDLKSMEDAEYYLWADNDAAGRDAMRRIELLLGGLRHKPKAIYRVRVESIPGLRPKWDLADWTPECGVDVLAELERAEDVETFEAMCREYIYVAQTDQFHTASDRSLIFSVAAFDRMNARYQDKSGSASKKFMCEPDTAKMDGLDFLPGGQTILISPQGKRFLNEWYPTENYSRAKEIAEDPTITDEEIAGKAVHFINHVKRIAGGAVAEPEVDTHTGQPVPGTHGRTVEDALFFWLSERVKNPMNKSGWVPMLLSQHNGTGKSYFVALIQAIFGGERAISVNTLQFLSQYEDWRDGKLFYELAEVGDESDSVYAALKKMHNYKPFDVRQLGDRTHNSVKLNIKSRGMKTQRDFINGYISGNNLFPIGLGSDGDSGGDRRLFVIRCEQKLSPQESEDLYGELITNAEWVAAWLLRFTPAYQWNLGWAPVTEHKRAMFELDRERAENRKDKAEIGNNSEVYHFLGNAQRKKLGGFVRAVITEDTVREAAAANGLGKQMPFNQDRFDKLMEKAGFHKGYTLEINGAPTYCYTHNPEWLEKTPEEWMTELKRSINGAGI